ncbi:unnamed protein product, partial [Anisakis simplex]|uniref:Peptidase_M13_N domain-containing protein n=1 Tax=Anisakis simplex TaxID=6269 RepID=A0A0M3KHN4_ANISI
MMPDELHEYLDTNPDIIVNEVDYLKKVTNLLKTVDARILTNYIVWRYTSAWSLQLGSRYDDILQDFLRVLIGKEVKSPRWKDCSATASSHMGDAASALYARKYFNTKDKKAVLDMIKDLHDAFREMVSENDWMDEQTKKIAIEKSKAMQSLIGYPDFVLSDKKLDDYYKLVRRLDDVFWQLKLEQGDTYASMAQKTTKWAQNYWFRKLIEPVDRTEFEFSSSTVNAFYAPPKNAI